MVAKMMTIERVITKALPENTPISTSCSTDTPICNASFLISGLVRSTDENFYPLFFEKTGLKFKTIVALGIKVEEKDIQNWPEALYGRK
jgi:hypothetical protein